MSASDVAPPTDIVPPEDETAEPVLPPREMMAEEQGEAQMTPDEAIEQIKSILAMLEAPRPAGGGMGNV